MNLPTRFVAQQMKRSVTICLFVSVLLTAGALKASARHDDRSTPTTSTGEWGNTIALTILGGRLYTVEKSGALYRTDLSTGRWVQLGKAEFGNTRLMFAAGQNLFTIETDGSLYRVSPVDGSWGRMGEAGAWKDTISVVTFNNDLFSVERNGALYRTDLSSGRWIQVGKPEFIRTRFLFAAGESLYSLESDGSLFSVNPLNGRWSVVGTPGDWKNTIVGTTLNGRIYTVEQSGALYETNPASGAWKQIGKAEFGNTRFLFAAGDLLYSIEAGDLYRINPTNGTWAAVGK